MNDVQLEVIYRKERLGLLDPKIMKIISLLMEIEELVINLLTNDDI